MLGKKVLTKQEIQDGVDLAFNIELIKDKQQFQGYLANFKTYSVKEEDLVEKSALLLYFIDENGKWWKSILKYMPYFYVQCNAEHLSEVQRFLEMKFEKHIAQISVVEKIDLEMINHLSGKMAKYLKLQFRTIHDLIEVRKTIKFRIDNYQKQNVIQFSLQDIIEGKKKQFNDMFEALEDIREFDVPYHTRVCIDLDIRYAPHTSHISYTSHRHTPRGTRSHSSASGDFACSDSRDCGRWLLLCACAYASTRVPEQSREMVPCGPRVRVRLVDFVHRGNA